MNNDFLGNLCSDSSMIFTHECITCKNHWRFAPLVAKNHYSWHHIYYSIFLEFPCILIPPPISGANCCPLRGHRYQDSEGFGQGGLGTNLEQVFTRLVQNFSLLPMGSYKDIDQRNVTSVPVRSSISPWNFSLLQFCVPIPWVKISHIECGGLEPLQK